MNIGPEIVLAGISALFSVILTGIASYIAWRGRDVLGDINDNTQFRQFMLGQEEFDRDDGELDEIDEQFDRLRDERQQEHAETKEQLEEIEEGMGYLTQFVQNIAGAINRSHLDDTVEEPEEFDRPGTWRGGEVEGSDD